MIDHSDARPDEDQDPRKLMRNDPPRAEDLAKRLDDAPCPCNGTAADNVGTGLWVVKRAPTKRHREWRPSRTTSSGSASRPYSAKTCRTKQNSAPHGHV